ncbi:hypothetical protein C8A01DRAFT_33913 [Parachaetomium inaequale]|uniref:Uncharacterized protein n=1 Tax=Parachaetomium inaequale TaxID=2588326 RepID=A0AAN6PJW2_9PEZI|nr:hypothetical protein C8A01DRAFT_33913 [Parachaetomium inaequale]
MRTHPNSPYTPQPPSSTCASHSSNKIQFYTTLCTLAAAGLAAAAPASAHLDVRADTFWELTGFGNPQCQGSNLWTYQGTGNACINVKTFAASFRYEFHQNTKVELINFPTCGLSGVASTEADATNTTSIDFEGRDDNSALAARDFNGCQNDSLQAFRVTIL